MAEISPWIIIARPGGEIGIKSKGTRRRIIHLLQSNIKRRLSFYQGIKIKYFRNYFLIKGDFNKENTYKAAQLLSKYEPGISSTNPAISSSSEEDEVIVTSLAFFPSFLEKNSTFAVRVKREGKHEYSSVDLAAKIGKAILNQHQSLSLKVDLTTPQHELNVDIKQDLAFYYIEKFSGLSGYPPGMQGSSIGLLRSCSFDFFALFLMLRRGVKLYPVFLKSDNCFHSSSEINEKLVREYCLKSQFFSIDLSPLLENYTNSSKCEACIIIRSLVGKTAQQRLKADGMVDGVRLSDLNPEILLTVDSQLQTRKFYPLLLNPEKLITLPFSIPIHEIFPKSPISEQRVLSLLQNKMKIENWKKYILENLHESFMGE
ncbi:MAG: THUMP domain-containing protein [Promethearchaeota archaeon]